MAKTPFGQLDLPDEGALEDADLARILVKHEPEIVSALPTLQQRTGDEYDFQHDRVSRIHDVAS